MTRPTNRRNFLTIVLLCASALACVSVESPQLRVQSLEFTGIGGGGLTFRVQINAYNPNTFELNLRNLEAQLSLDGNDAGSSVTAVAMTLPVQRWTPVTANVAVPWNSAPGWLLAAAGNPSVHYRLDGHVTVDHYLSIRAPFSAEGDAPRSFFLSGATNTINSVINSVLPGFGGLQAQKPH